MKIKNVLFILMCCSSVFGDTSFPYEGANCPNTISVNQAVYLSKIDKLNFLYNDLKILRESLSENEKIYFSMIKDGINTDSQEKALNQINKFIEAKEKEIESVKISNKNKLSENEFNITETDSGFIMSEDCNSLYVLPPRFGKATITAAGFLSTIRDCDQVEHYQGMIKTYEEIRNSLKLDLKIALKDKNYEEVQKVNELIDYYFERTNNLRISLKNIEEDGIGYSANLLFEANWQQLVLNYSLFNPTKSVKKMPIWNSNLTSNYFNLNGNSFDNKSGVYSFQVPGLKNPKTDLLSFNGTRSGLLHLNIRGSCPLYKAIGELPYERDITLEELNSAVKQASQKSFAVNVELEYPVYMKKGFKISINDNNLAELDAFMKKTKEQVNTTTFIEKFFSNKSSSIVNVEIFDHNPNGSDPELEFMAQELRLKIEDQLLEKFLELYTETVEGSLEYYADFEKNIKLDINEENYNWVKYKTRNCRTKETVRLGVVRSSQKKCKRRKFYSKAFYKTEASSNYKNIIEFKNIVEDSYVNKGTIVRQSTLGFK